MAGRWPLTPRRRSGMLFRMAGQAEGIAAFMRLGFLHSLKYTRLLASFVRLNFPPRPLPVKLTFSLTNRCQYRCQTCRIWEKPAGHELTTAEVIAFIRKNTYFQWVDLTGGEIFLRPDLEEILDAMLASWRHLCLLHFPTNGYLTDRIAAITARLREKTRATILVTVSVDGDESLNDELRGIPGGYRRQIETFRKLREIPSIMPFIGMTLSAVNAGRIGATFAALQRDIPDFTSSRFHLNVAGRSAHYYGNVDADFPAAEEKAVLDALEECRGLSRDRGRDDARFVEQQFRKGLRSFLRRGRPPVRCLALRSNVFIDPEGRVFPCITYSQPLGSLREHEMDLRPVWYSEEARMLRREIARGRCPGCWTACEAVPSLIGHWLSLRRGRKT